MKQIALRNKLTLLGLLSESPMHGYQINTEIDQRSMGMWANISTASIYTTLLSLEKSKLISVKLEKVGRMPERRVYSITKKGKAELKNMIISGLSKLEKRNNILFLLSVGFISNISKEEAVKSLNIRDKYIAGIITMVSEIERTHKSFLPFNWLYIINTSLDQLNIELNGTRSLIKDIRKSLNKLAKKGFCNHDKKH